MCWYLEWRERRQKGIWAREMWGQSDWHYANDGQTGLCMFVCMCMCTCKLYVC